MTGLGDLPGGSFNSRALATSGDGSVVVGYSSTTGTETSEQTREAFIWRASSGQMEKLQTILEDLGLDSELAGWTLREATDVNANGTVIVTATSGFEVYR